MNLFIDDGQWEIEDEKKTLSEYLDHNTNSGNTVHVSSLQCGKELSANSSGCAAILLQELRKVRIPFALDATQVLIACIAPSKLLPLPSRTRL